MSIDPAEFRRVLSRFATGVTVVAAVEPGGPACGLTATAVASVSLTPPLVLACVDRASATHDCIERAGAFAISMLGGAGEETAVRFAEGGSGKFDGVGYRTAATGAPILDDVMAWLDCVVWAAYDGGDHTIFVGEVVAADAAADGGDGSPLIHFAGGYLRLDR